MKDSVSFVLVFKWNHFEMKLLNLRINFYLLQIFCPHLGSFCCFFFHYVLAKFHLWPSSGDLPWPRIGMLSLVTVSPVITAFHSCCLSHHVFDQVNLWSAWVGFETAIFWRCSPRTVETQRLYPLRHGPRRAIKDGFFGLPESGPYRIFVLVFNWNHFEMRLPNLRINFYLLRIFCPHLGSFCCFRFVFLLSLRFGQISPLAFFRWFTATSDRNAESCNCIPSNYCLP